MCQKERKPKQRTKMIDIKALTEESEKVREQRGIAAFNRFSYKLPKGISKAIKQGHTEIKFNYPFFLRKRYQSSFYNALKEWGKENGVEASANVWGNEDLRIRW